MRYKGKYTPIVYGYPSGLTLSDLLMMRDIIKSILSRDIAVTQHFDYPEKISEEDIIPIILTNEPHIPDQKIWIIEVNIGRIDTQIIRLESNGILLYPRLSSDSDEIFLYPISQAMDLADKLAKEIWKLLKKSCDVLARVKYSVEDRKSVERGLEHESVLIEDYQTIEAFLDKE